MISILPCRDEAPALRDLLPRVPAGFSVIVVDNGSRDDTADVARAFGATRGDGGPTPGYGAAVHAGIVAATAEYVAVMDGDGSFDPAELAPLLDDVVAGRADLAVGRRRPVARGVWPWHARAGQRRRRLAGCAAGSGWPCTTSRPMRVCRREALLDLDVTDRRFGYPVELLHGATVAGWRISRARRGLPPARRGHPLEGLRLGARHRPHGPRLLRGAVR